MIYRPTTTADIPHILELYKSVAHRSGGIIRFPEEVTSDYVTEFVTKSVASGIGLVAETDGQIVAEIHAYPYGLQAFRHILTDLTIVVHPDYQGRGVGKVIFEKLLEEVKSRFPHVLRVELFVRESNEKAVAFYQKLGFVEEGRHRHKIKNQDGQLETPIEMTWFNPAYGVDR